MAINTMGKKVGLSPDLPLSPKQLWHQLPAFPGPFLIEKAGLLTSEVWKSSSTNVVQNVYFLLCNSVSYIFLFPIRIELVYQINS
jgi:hypothetical protein